MSQPEDEGLAMARDYMVRTQIEARGALGASGQDKLVVVLHIHVVRSERCDGHGVRDGVD